VELTCDNAVEVQQHLISLGWLQPVDQIVRIEPAGEGNMNVTLRATLADRSLILKQSRPFVAKYPDIPAPLERLDVEAAFYGAVSASPAVAGQMPELLGYDPANHLLALEDLGASADFSHLYDSGSHAQGDGLPSAELLNWLGRLHTLDPAHLDVIVFDNQAMRRLNHAHIFEIPLTADNGLEFPPARAAIARRFAADQIVRDKAAELGRLYLAPPSTSSRLLHGDFYPGSWLATEAGIRIIDFEFAFIGPVEFDLGVFLGHCLMSGHPPDTLFDLLEAYSAPAPYDPALALAFAGIEIIRRLLGVAQLPLTASEATLSEWLDWGYDKVSA